ncbi:2'-5' RNA ligase family protein [Nocardioides zeae]|uniref:2'-5' RNA ligase family protein n=1 Tax=Nocardioides imazamoxiresistens TaxID=3231893 RepID=A0ABU3PQE9_9ACTN|nr:2'-5' RNA ligase family protein [Nocardioides zeae]MDT9591443.1 2'-5' RNA ligase family protein [Nocardioides zeae]
MRDSLDLLLDGPGEAAVRAEWDALSAAGVPSSGDRTGGHHGPHVTVAERDRVAEDLEARLDELAVRLPLTLRLGPPLVLGGPGRRVLARAVVATPALLDLHAAAAAVLGPGGPPHGEVGAWTPHVTLSGRLGDDDVAGALGALGEAYAVRAVRLRRWMPASGTVRDLPRR